MLLFKSVYDDVVPAFDRWKQKGFNIYIYSSGSIEAQKLIFGYSDKGNLLKVKNKTNHFFNRARPINK